jgi:protein NrfC
VKKNPLKVPPSKGYIVVDSKKCAGCQSCMVACSLVHEGKINLSLSRIQVAQDIVKSWPDDIKVVQCRQCVYPICVQVCPTEALHVDPVTGVRSVEESKCNGCQLCINFCPHPPHRTIWNHEKRKVINCDLCSGARFWKERGGVAGKQACVEVCPARAIVFVTRVPRQTDDVGYDRHLGPEEQAGPRQ